MSSRSQGRGLQMSSGRLLRELEERKARMGGTRTGVGAPRRVLLLLVAESLYETGGRQGDECRLSSEELGKDSRLGRINSRWPRAQSLDEARSDWLRWVAASTTWRRCVLRDGGVQSDVEAPDAGTHGFAKSVSADLDDGDEDGDEAGDEAEDDEKEDRSAMTDCASDVGEGRGAAESASSTGKVAVEGAKMCKGCLEVEMEAGRFATSVCCRRPCSSCTSSVGADGAC